MTLSLLAHYFSEKSKFSDFLTFRRGDKKRDSNGPFVIVAALQTNWRTAVPLSAAGRLGIKSCCKPAEGLQQLSGMALAPHASLPTTAHQMWTNVFHFANRQVGSRAQ